MLLGIAISDISRNRAAGEIKKCTFYMEMEKMC